MQMIHIEIFTLLFIVDSFLLVVTRKIGLSEISKYYIWHRQQGFIKVMLLKLFLIAVIIYMHLSFPARGGFTVGFEMAYIIYIASLVRDLIRQRKR